MSSKMRDFLTAKIKDSQEKLYISRHHRGGTLFLYNTKTTNIDFWDSGEKDILRESNVIHRYKRLITASRSHTSGMRSGLLEMSSELTEKYSGLWLVSYEETLGITKVRDYVNFGIKMYIDEGIIGFFSTNLLRTGDFITAIKNFLQNNNVYSTELSGKFFIITPRVTTFEVREILEMNGIQYTSQTEIGREDFSFLLDSEEDYNLLKLILDRKLICFSTSIKDFKEQFIDSMLRGLDEKTKNYILFAYQNSEVHI